MATIPDEIYRHFLIKRTQVEMLMDRGYPISDNETRLFLAPESEDPSDGHLMRFVRAYSLENRGFDRELMTQTYESADITYVHYAPLTVRDKQGIGAVKTFIDEAREIGADTAIIISDQPFTPSAANDLAEITEPRIQIFFDNQLFMNPTKHIHTPKHIKLSFDERATLLKESRAQPNQLEKMSIDDPIAVYYGWRIGDLIKIERVNMATHRSMAWRSVAYRLVSGTHFPPNKPPAKKPAKAT